MHVMLRQYPHGPGEVKVELSVIDTGKVFVITILKCDQSTLTLSLKGISQNFLKVCIHSALCKRRVLMIV